MGWLKPSQMSRMLGLLLSTTASISSADAQSFAKVGAVNSEATGTPPGGAVRTLTVGSSIVLKERIRTSSSGSTQIQFPDQSALNLGANCDMVIDEFVYNANSKSGTMVATASRGVLRYIGGQISHNSGVTIKTPSATVGIRGGIFSMMLSFTQSFGALDPALAGLRGDLLISHFGQSTVSNNAGSVTLRPGFATVVGSPNQLIPAPFRLSEATLRLIMNLISSQPGRHGGVANIPTDAGVPPGFGQTIVQNPTNPPGTDPLGYTSIFGAGNAAGSAVSQTNQIHGLPQPPPTPCVSYC